MRGSRRDVQRRLGQLEGQFGGEARCKWGLPDEVARKSWTMAIVMVGPGEDASETCTVCGGRRVVYRVSEGLRCSLR
jgi:hypothetical protein